MRVKWTSSELKEIILGILALLWGLLLLFPENSLLPYGGIDLYQFYAQDWLWGIYLIVAGVSILVFSSDSYKRLRRVVHFSLWVFWLGISTIVFLRVSRNGISATDIMLFLPFVAIAFLHAAIYTRLAKLT